MRNGSTGKATSVSEGVVDEAKGTLWKVAGALWEGPDNKIFCEL